MKKSYLALITFGLISISFMSCKASSNKAQTENENIKSAIDKEEASTDTLAVKTDSCQLTEGKFLDCIIRVDYPTGTDDLAANIRKILNQKMADNYVGMTTQEDGDKHYKPYSGDLSDGNAVVTKYCKDNFSNLKAQMEDIKKYDLRAHPNMSYELNLTKNEETGKYITYGCFSYVYLAGAHGSTFEQSFNIVKSTGKLLTETVDTTQVKKLQPILRKGIISNLNQDNQGDPITDKTLNDCLFIGNGIIPLPANTPYLAKDGVHFVYQQYEIGPYAMGIVEFTVPYADIKPYLTQETLQLLQ